jgi:hypothetical protein
MAISIEEDAGAINYSGGPIAIVILVDRPT